MNTGPMKDHTTGSECQDEFVSCKTWAGNGDCTTKEAWMKLTVKGAVYVPRHVSAPHNYNMFKFLLLLQFHTLGVSCVDSDKIKCTLWAKEVNAKKNHVWMKKNCAKSCKACAPVDGQWIAGRIGSLAARHVILAPEHESGSVTIQRPLHGGKTCPGSASDQSSLYHEKVPTW
ncbi:hypothetical protein OS493_037031 [Desmophyllum pertusum]|uniref:ShKT domain-containing protein n=1 Tax=Desmophyllum pertusum TaxID=174260 RepID=A0A9W9Y8Q7_9CNID|nr:hypothetical protein OS493_037031 [Desmophyllum pertusum]